MNIGRYSKLLGALTGNLVGILLVWAATRGLAECRPVSGAEVCEVFGFDQTELTAGILTVINSAFVYFFPANRPPA